MEYLRRLASWLDRPFFPWKRLIAGFSLAEFLIDNYLKYRQYKVLQRNVIPKALKGEVDQETFDKSQSYGRTKAKFSFFSGCFNQTVELAVLYYNVYPKVWELSGHLIASYFPARFSGEITQSLVFTFVYSLITTIIGLPFDYYSTFVIEERFGFNKQTVKIWVTDILKGIALQIAFGIPILSAMIGIIKKTGDQFFYYVYLLIVAVQMFMLTIYPSLIMPLFNTFTPLEPGPLRKSIEELANSLKFPLGKLEVMDGSRHSAHSNAFFTGLPWNKRIVLFDTLIEQMSNAECTAVLGHELGHWKMGHVMKSLGIGQVHLFSIFALFSAFIDNKSLYQDFGFHKEQPVIIGLMLFMSILTPANFVLELLMHILSRHNEFEADAFAKKLGYSKDLASSLLKLHVKNLSAMDVDWMYSAFNYSHPHVNERLRALGWEAGTIKEQSSEKDADGAAHATGREL